MHAVPWAKFEAKAEDEDESEEGRTTQGVGMVVTVATVAGLPRNLWRRPFTPTMCSRRCLAQRRAFMSEA